MAADRYEEATELIMAARNYPQAETAAEHFRRGNDIYKLLHMASEIIIFELIEEAHREQDIHLHDRQGRDGI